MSRSVLTGTTGSPGTRIVGVGAHLPTRVVANDEIARRIDSNDNWIRVRSGITSRHFAGPDESVTDMAVAAASKAVANAGADPGDVDLVLVATCSHDVQVPGVAAEVAHRIGAAPSGGWDVNGACAGFCYALASASDAVRSGSARLAVVVASERFTNFLDLDDRGTAFIFGDGAGAVVVAGSNDIGIGPVVWGSDGTQRHLIAQNTADDARSAAGLPYLRMEGPAVYRWAVTAVAAIAQQACERAGIKPAELGAFVPHQANLRIIDALARQLQLPESVVVSRDIAEAANTSAASVPIALTHLMESGAVPSGSPALLLGFGAGLTYAAQVVLTP